MSCCAQEALRMGTPLSRWQQRGNLKQGHINWPRYCNHVHKGQYPACKDVCLLGGHTNYCVSAQASISVHQRLAGFWHVIICWIYPVTFASAFIRPSIRWHPPLLSSLKIVELLSFFQWLIWLNWVMERHYRCMRHSWDCPLGCCLVKKKMMILCVTVSDVHELVKPLMN